MSLSYLSSALPVCMWAVSLRVRQAGPQPRGFLKATFVNRLKALLIEHGVLRHAQPVRVTGDMTLHGFAAEVLRVLAQIRATQTVSRVRGAPGTSACGVLSARRPLSGRVRPYVGDAYDRAHRRRASYVHLRRLTAVTADTAGWRGLM